MGFWKKLFGTRERVSVDDPEQFAIEAMRSSVECRVRIPEVATVLRMLYAKHEEAGKAGSGTKYVEMVYKRLCGTCPECGIRSGGEMLYVILMASNVGVDNLSFLGNATGRSELARGVCRGSGCSSGEIILQWD